MSSCFSQTRPQLWSVPVQVRDILDIYVESYMQQSLWNGSSQLHSHQEESPSMWTTVPTQSPPPYIAHVRNFPFLTRPMKLLQSPRKYKRSEVHFIVSQNLCRTWIHMDSRNHTVYSNPSSFKPQTIAYIPLIILFWTIVNLLNCSLCIEVECGNEITIFVSC